MAPPNDYFSGFEDYLGGLQSENQSLLDGITAERDRLITERDNLDEHTGAESGGGFAALVAPILGGLLSGKGKEGLAYGFLGGAKNVDSYYNNLAEEEKVKRQNLSDLLGTQDALLRDTINRGQALDSANLNILGQRAVSAENRAGELSNQLSLQTILGKVPGTAEYNAAQDAEFASREKQQEADAARQVNLEHLKGNIKLLPDGTPDPYYQKDLQATQTFTPEGLNMYNQLAGEAGIEGQLPEGATIREAQAITGLRSAVTGAQGEFRRSVDKQMELANAGFVAGFQRNPNVPVDVAETRKIAAMNTAYKVYSEEIVPKLRQVLSQGSQFDANKAESLRALFGRATEVGRLLSGAGANFTDIEVQNVIGWLPQVVDNPKSSWARIIADRFRGVDYNNSMNNFLGQMRQELGIRAKVRGFYRPDFADLYTEDDYNSNIIPRGLPMLQDFSAPRPNAQGGFRTISGGPQQPSGGLDVLKDAIARLRGGQ